MVHLVGGGVNSWDTLTLDGPGDGQSVLALDLSLQSLRLLPPQALGATLTFSLKPWLLP